MNFITFYHFCDTGTASKGESLLLLNLKNTHLEKNVGMTDC